MTWRGPGDFAPLPPELAETLELKQKALLVYPFVNPFADELQPLVRSGLEKTRRCLEESKAIGNAACFTQLDFAEPVDSILRSRTLKTDLLTKNREMIEIILSEARRALTGALMKRFPDVRRSLLVGQADSPGITAALTHGLVTEIVTITQIAVMNACIDRYGRPFCEPLTHRDERDPFGIIYRSEDSVSRILRSDFTDVRTD